MTLKEIVIKPKAKWMLVDFGELWTYRQLLFFLTWKDIKVRYKQTFIGVIWVIFQPLVSAGIFTIFFGKLAKIPSDNLPYQLFVFMGLVLWIFFSQAVSSVSNSFVDNANIIKKVYFPREILSISAIFTSFVDFSINFSVLIILTLYYGYIPSPLAIIIMPLVLLIAACSAGGLGLFLASLNVKYRDVRYILPFFIQSLLFLTPVIYPSSTVRDSFRYLLAINPMTGVIETTRVVISGSGTLDWITLLISLLGAIFLLVFGLGYFRLTERFFADIA